MKLIGMIGLSVTKVIKQERDGTVEMIARLAFDTDGQCWALVQRIEPIKGLSRVRGRRTSAPKMIFDARWQRCSNLPIVDEPVIDLMAPMERPEREPE